MIFDLDLLFSKPKGPDNPFLYYPEYYDQDASQSVIDQNHKYDMDNFSKHEATIIRDVLYTTQKKYPKEFWAPGLVNESYTIKYKPRYILFEAAILLYKNSELPIEQISVAFAYSQKGADYRKEAIRFYEKSINTVPFYVLDKFASISSFAMYLTLSDLYEQEHEYDKAIVWMKKAQKRAEPNNVFCAQKIKELSKKEAPKPRKKKMPSTKKLVFEEKVTSVAQYCIDHGWRK